MEDITVLMSTYNGEKYIKEQIDSILNQKKVRIKLLIRDDGSIDNTVNIINSYNDHRISCIKGKNIGAVHSFFELIKVAPYSSYYAFSDQDDVWEEDKLYVAIKKLEGYQLKPAIYSSESKIVDDTLELISISKTNPNISLGSAIVKNYVAGCTAVFNDKLMKKLKISTDVEVPYHDWWANLVALSTGGISYFDNQPHIKYRQHGKNIVGANISMAKKIVSRIKKYKETCYKRDYMAQKLIDLYQDQMVDEVVELLKQLSDYKRHKISLVLCKTLSTGNIIDDLLFDILIITNRL